MLIEGLAAASVAIGGTIVLMLWVDQRAELDGAALITFGCLVLGAVAAAAGALRFTALDFGLGSVAGVTLALAGWTGVVLLTTRPAPQSVPRDRGGVDGPPLRTRKPL